MGKEDAKLRQWARQKLAGTARHSLSQGTVNPKECLGVGGSPCEGFDLNLAPF